MAAAHQSARGSKVPLYASASGKLFLAHSPKRDARPSDQCAADCAHEKHLDVAAATGTEFTKIRRSGYAVDNEGYLAGICCLAVPVMNDQERVVAAVAVHGPGVADECGAGG